MDILEIPFVGAYELRKNLPLLLGQIQKKEEGVVVTRKGKPAAILLSIKGYLKMKILNEELEDALKELTDQDYLRGLLTTQKEIRAGKGKEAKKLFKELNL